VNSDPTERIRTDWQQMEHLLLEASPASPGSTRQPPRTPSREEIRQMLREIGKYSVCVDIGVGIGAIFSSALDSGWVYAETEGMEAVQKAYELQYPGEAAMHTFHDKIADLAERSPEAVDGFISGIKGKLAELQSEHILESHFPGWDFNLAADSTQPIWDLHGVDGAGHEMLVQIKMQGAEAASNVADLAQPGSDVLFGVSSEIYDQIAQTHPEIIGHFIDLHISNAVLSAETADIVNAVAAEGGIPVDHSISDLLPWVGEAVLALRLLSEVISTNRKLSSVSLDDRKRIITVRVLCLLARYGVVHICTAIGAAAGGPVGAGIALVVSIILNKGLQPRIVEFALDLVGFTENDLFAIMNWSRVEQLTLSFREPLPLLTS
jgi:hypothetical protein